MYLKAKVDYTSGNVPVEQVIQTLMKAIRIGQNIPLTKGPQDLNLAMMFLLKATIYSESQQKYKEAVKVYQKAKKIIVGV